MPQKQGTSPKIKRAGKRAPGFVPRIQGKRRGVPFDPNNCLTEFRDRSGVGSVQQRDQQAWQRRQSLRQFRELQVEHAMNDLDLLNLTGLELTAALKFLEIFIEMEQKHVDQSPKSRSQLAWNAVTRELGDERAVRKGCMVAKNAVKNAFDITKQQFDADRQEPAMAE